MRSTKRLRGVTAATGAAGPGVRPAWRYEERSRFLKYLAVGTVGFLVDAALLALQVRVFGLGPLLARGPSFLGAVTVTWWLNRNYTFDGLGQHAAGKEYRRYFVVQVMGALTNLAVYALAILSLPWFADRPVAALALGSAFGLIVNYGLARIFVFAGAKT